MWRGLYIAATGMITEMHHTDMIANNLANADTAGFKRDDMAIGEFAPMLLRRINDHADSMDVTTFKGFSIGNTPPVVGKLGLGSYVDEIAVDHNQGALQTTGNALDVAVSGSGYFIIATPEGPRYTRDGSFFRSTTGEIQNSKGQTVLSNTGRPLTIPPETAQIIISGEGDIFADGVNIGRLGFVEFDNKAVYKQGDNLFRPHDGVTPRPATGTIQQGVIEMSNTAIVTEMVELINNYRVYEAASKAVQTQDSALDTAVNRVGTLS